MIAGSGETTGGFLTGYLRGLEWPTESRGDRTVWENLRRLLGKMPIDICGNSSVGRAQPCQGWGREFESRFPLQVRKNPDKIGVLRLGLSHA